MGAEAPRGEGEPQRVLLLQGHEWTTARSAAARTAPPATPAAPDPAAAADGRVPPSQRRDTEGAPPWWAVDWALVPQQLRETAERMQSVLNRLQTGFSTGDPTSPARDDPDPRYKPTVLRDDRANAPGQDLAGVVHEAPKHDLLSKTEDYYSPAEAAQLLGQPQASIAVWRHQEVGRPT